MKALVFLIVAALLILTAHVSYDAGQGEAHRLQELCDAPGVRCVIEFGSGYLVAHPRIEGIPGYLVPELADERGGLR